MTAGIGKMRFPIFLLADFLACSMTTGLYFYLFYTYGESMLRQVQNIGLGLFTVIILSLLLIFWKRRRNKTISA
jgi:membrane protein DedA with SNARE-associated domain